MQTVIQGQKLAILRLTLAFGIVNDRAFSKQNNLLAKYQFCFSVRSTRFPCDFLKRTLFQSLFWNLSHSNELVYFQYLTTLLYSWDFLMYSSFKKWSNFQVSKKFSKAILGRLFAFWAFLDGNQAKCDILTNFQYHLEWEKWPIPSHPSSS